MPYSHNATVKQQGWSFSGLGNSETLLDGDTTAAAVVAGGNTTAQSVRKHGAGLARQMQLRSDVKWGLVRIILPPSEQRQRPWPCVEARRY